MTNAQVQPIKVLLADDHEIFLHGLEVILQKQPEIEVVGTASDGEECIRLADQLQPDIILTDIMMPVMDGITATRMIAREHPAIGIIALSMSDQENQIVDILEAGARGYLSKNIHKNEIMEAILSVYQNMPYYCRTTTTRLARLIGKSRFQLQQSFMPVEFSNREKMIIRMICEEKTTKEIGDALIVSSRTVDGYRTKILEKMQVKSVTGLVIYAIRNNLFNV